MTFRERLRAFELDLERRMPDLQCSVHLCLGQEDVPEVLHEMLRPGDWLFSSHRSHGHYLAKGGDERRLLDEILGLETGVNGGYSGSQSFVDVALKFHSTAIVGGLIGVATGTALAMKLEASENLVVCCFGDAAAEQGILWESLNFAALHALPIVYVCENNGLSVHAPLKVRQATPLRERVKAFGVRYYGREPDDLRLALRMGRLHDGPEFAEVRCERQCRHVSAMEDLRE